MLEHKSNSNDETEKQRIETEMCTELMNEKYKLIENDLLKVKSQQTQTFALKRLISGGSNSFHLETKIDPFSKEILVEKPKILQDTLEYTSGILQNNISTGDNYKLMNVLRECHNLRMNNLDAFDAPEEKLSFQDFEKEILSVKQKGKNNYNDLIRSGRGFRYEVFKFLKYIWESEEIPR